MVSANGSAFTTKQGAVCLVGDTHSCPIHGNSQIVSGGSVNAKANGKSIAINGAVAGCGAVLNGNFAADVNLT
jgi:uncharacterized Zn-binding protein involved in type VI secretion